MPTDIPIELAEQSEAETMCDLETHTPPDVRATLGITSTCLGGGVALCAGTDPSQYWSKALGFRFQEPVTAELIAEVCAFYRAGGAELATLQLAPSVLPESWDEICTANGRNRRLPLAGRRNRGRNPRDTQQLI